MDNVESSILYRDLRCNSTNQGCIITSILTARESPERFHLPIAGNPLARDLSYRIRGTLWNYLRVSQQHK